MAKKVEHYKVKLDVIKDSLKILDMSFTTMSQKAAIGFDTLKILKRESKATLEVIKRIADLFGFEMEEIADISEANECKLKRIKLDMTREEACKEIGICKCVMAKIESGEYYNKEFLDRVNNYYDEILSINDEYNYDYQSTICSAVMRFSC